MLNLPSVYCFLHESELEDLKYDNTYYQTEDSDFYNGYDWDRDNYTFVEEYDSAGESDWDRYNYGIRNRIIQRKSDGKYFKWYEHTDSWMDGVTCLWVGEYGDIAEVVSEVVTKTVWKEVG